MEEFSAAQVKADVRNARAGGVEKYQIAGLQVARADGAAGGGHIARTARQVHAEGVFVNILDHAAAIESGIGAAAPAVGCADQIHAVQHQFLPAGGAVDVADADVFGAFLAAACGLCLVLWLPVLIFPPLPPQAESPNAAAASSMSNALFFIILIVYSCIQAV